jgi:hypothetical protein
LAGLGKAVPPIEYLNDTNAAFSTAKALIQA